MKGELLDATRAMVELVFEGALSGTVLGAPDIAEVVVVDSLAVTHVPAPVPFEIAFLVQSLSNCSDGSGVGNNHISSMRALC